MIIGEDEPALSTVYTAGWGGKRAHDAVTHARAVNMPMTRRE